MKDKKFSVRLSDKEIEIVENLSKLRRISNSEAIRLFIDMDKIVVIKEFDKMIPVLVNLTMLLEKNEQSDNLRDNVKEEVDAIWRLLNSVTANHVAE